jgi:hypothetical protein
MNPVSLAARNAVAGKKVAASPESRVREVGSFLFIVEQNTPQIFDNLQTSPKKNNLPKVCANGLAQSRGPGIGALATAYVR